MERTDWLRDMIDLTDIPEPLKNMVSDYNVQVVDIRRLKDTGNFKTDVRHIFEFLRYCEDKKSLLNLVTSDAYYQNVSEDAYEVIARYANTKGIVKMNKYKNENGGIDVCKGIRDLITDSREEGVSVGQKECFNSRTKEIIINMLKKGMSTDDTCEIAECDTAYAEQLRQTIIVKRTPQH